MFKPIFSLFRKRVESQDNFGGSATVRELSRGRQGASSSTAQQVLTPVHENKIDVTQTKKQMEAI